MAGQLNGKAAAITAAGFVLFWSGLKNQTLTVTLRSLLRGQNPPASPEQPPTLGVGSAASTAPAAAAGTGPGPGPGDTSAHNAGAAANQAIARLLAAPYGWSAGQQWDDLVSLWNRESGWDNTARNPQSGAYGIAQALGHGPSNQYPAGPANPPPFGTSSATAQISWGLSYIKDTYGSPSAAWEHEQANGWY